MKKDNFKLVDQQKWFSLVVELLESGFSLKEAVLFSQTIYPKMQPILKDINTKMALGYSFADAIRDWVAVDTYYQMSLAEQHGQLLMTLHYFSDYIQVRLQQSKKLKHLLEYPLILICLLGMIVCMIVFFVLPQLNSIENSYHEEILSNIVQPVAWLSSSIVTILLYKFYYFKRKPTICQIRQLCRLPIIGKIYCDYYGYYFCSNLSLLLLEGLSLQKIIKMCHTFDREALLYQIGQELDGQLNNGVTSINDYIHNEIFIPNELSILISQGQSIGDLGKQVQSLGNHLFKRMVIKCEQKMVLVQPLIYLIIASVILVLYLKILMPIYQTVEVMK